MPTSLVALNIPRPSPRPVKSGSKPFKRPGPRTRRATKRPYVKNTPAICSGSLVGNDKCFVTSEECGRIVQKSWNEKKQGMYTEVGGEQILTRNCVISPKSAHGASIAVCGLDAAVNPNTVVVPCYPAAEVQASEILLTESQTNLNNGLKADKTEITWLPTHPTIDGSTSAVKGFKFETGFVGSGKSLCNVETGIPIYRDTADGSRELMGINIKTKADHGCSDSLSFASITRHGSWIAAQCAQFADADSVKFEVLPKNEATCSTDKVITFNNACTPVDVTSPGYPSLYENDQICSWKLIAPKGHQIVVTFLDVDIERSNHKRKCNHDALLWKVGNEKTDVEVCSSQDHRARYVSPKESASLEFRTDSSFKGRGFRARVSCQKRG